MAKKNRGKGGKAPHANGVEEVMQKVRERAAAAKPPLTEEERLTVEEAREVLKALAEKTIILTDATEERDRLEAESARLKEDLAKQEAVYKAKEKTLLLNDAAQAVLDQRDSILAQAEREKTAIRASAEKDAEAVKRSAEAEARSAAADLRAQAEAEAKAILDAARAEERKIIDSKEQTARLCADAVMARAEDFEKRARASAEAFETQVRENAHQRAAEILAAGEEKLKKQEEFLEQRRAELEKREIALTEREASIPDAAEALAQERTAALRAALEARSAALARRQAELRDREEELSYLSAELEEEKRLFKQRLDEAVTAQYAALKNELAEKRETATALSRKNQELYKALDEVKMKANQRMAKQGGEALVEKAEHLEKECERLQKILKDFEMNGITPERTLEITGQRERIEDLQTQIQGLQAELDAARHQAAMNTGSADRLSETQSRMASLKETNRELMEELNKRRQVSREDMLRPIVQEVPAFLNTPLPEEDPADLAREDVWLEHIREQSQKSGIIFSPRQLTAYHTCLKINAWSPMVVLSGVSGTGKSELPKQYAVHGGMRFLSLPVKPDWDSPASLFGYYNSIENKFEATELVRALYQMQREKKTRWSRGMLMVLLDEMNLAHPEQYFADLLSKFEEARNAEKDPSYEIVLGAGEPSMPLDIGRNVLWTGTMNEDETTKGLSDKVIDRSMLITFPCPKELYDRDNSKLEPPRLTLSFQRWNEWKDGAVHKDDAAVSASLEKRKAMIQKVNRSLSAMGRNLGHRVWQSIQNYILNYPSVILAVRDRKDPEPFIQEAFCDALAFKMMPKLRGLEVRGQNEEHIEAIRKCLAEDAPELIQDFESACSLTSEVFQWNSASFMGM